MAADWYSNRILDKSVHSWIRLSFLQTPEFVFREGPAGGFDTVSRLVRAQES